MLKLLLWPQNAEVWLPDDAALTDLEFELYGQASIPFGCRAGACGACVIEVIEGAAPFNDRGEAEAAFLARLGYPGEAFRLACQCRLRSDATIRAVSPSP